MAPTWGLLTSPAVAFFLQYSALRLKWEEGAHSPCARPIRRTGVSSLCAAVMMVIQGSLFSWVQKPPGLAGNPVR